MNEKKFNFVLATTITIGITIFCVVWALIFNFNPINPEQQNPLFGLLWCAFSGLGLVVAQQGSFETLPHMLCSALCGPLYGVFFFGMLDWVMGFGASPIFAFFLCALVVTYVLALVHVVVLAGTWFSFTAFTLGTYGIWFALNTPNNPPYFWLYGSIFFLIGTVYGTIFVPIALAIMKNISKPQDSSVKAKG